MNEPSSDISDIEPENKSSHVVKRKSGWRSPLAKVLISLCGIAVVGTIGWIVVKQNFRADFDEHASPPDIESGSASGEQRGGVTDLFLDNPIDQAEHPLDPALLVAKAGLQHFRDHVEGYTATVVKQERVNGVLLAKEFFECKIRQPRTHGNKKIQKSFYLKFINPKRIAGREVIWVEGRNRGLLTAHEGGALSWLRVNLKPTNAIAMRGNRYPITELGLENLIVRMIEKGERDRKLGNCEVTVDRSLVFDGHKASLITITHPKKSDDFEFYQAKIYFDDELNVPVGYEGFLWPEKPGGPPVLIERYFYSNLKINPGLTDLDFDPRNPAYKFP